MNFPELIPIPIWADIRRADEDETVWVKTEAHINPINVSCFLPSAIKYENKEIKSTIISVAGMRFQVRMEYKEFCEFWINTEKSIKMEEPLF